MSEKPQKDELLKQLQQNAQFLTDSELISFLLRSGGKMPVEVAQELLTQVGGLPGLLEIQQQPFCQIKGLGESKYFLFKACIELTRRLHRFFEHVDSPPVLDIDNKALQYLLFELRNRNYQALFGFFLDKQQNPLALIEHLILTDRDNSVVYKGESVLNEVLNRASQYQATTFILAHFYPTGGSYPMPIDISLSQRMVRELPAMELQMLDYVVVGRTHHISLASKGFLVP
jgi:DNA repair protein RadC